MTEWLLFIYGFAAGGTGVALYALRINNEWYRRSREVAKSITNDFTALIRETTEHVNDPVLAQQLRDEADRCDAVWADQ